MNDFKECPVCGQIFIPQPGEDTNYCSKTCMQNDLNGWISQGKYIGLLKEYRNGIEHRKKETRVHE